MPSKQNEKKKKRNIGLFQKWLNYFRPKENPVAQRTKETSTEASTKDYERAVSVKQKTVTT